MHYVYNNCKLKLSTYSRHICLHSAHWPCPTHSHNNTFIMNLQRYDVFPMIQCGKLNYLVICCILIMFIMRILSDTWLCGWDSVPGCGPAALGELFPKFRRNVLPLPLRVWSHIPEERTAWRLSRFSSYQQELFCNICITLLVQKLLYVLLWIEILTIR